MCGITGIVKLTSTTVQLPKLIQTMTGCIKHRGPDGEGFLLATENECKAAYGDDTPSSIKNSGYTHAPTHHIDSLGPEFEIAFGHRRLSIIDLSDAGHQPMCAPKKKLWITYNGEIYNYIELREELKTLGYHFQTATDTEVILAAYQEWGAACVNKFNGMWAFVIYDVQQKKLFGSRDRFGVKPLYYVRTDSYFAFASEQKALLKAGLIQPKLNDAAVFDYFVFSKIENEEEGMFKGIFELQQACNFEFSLQDKKLTTWKYYSLPLIGAFEIFDETKFQKLVYETREAIIQSVRLRLRSDVAVGSCLSGGIDSSSIVSIMNNLLKGEQRKINVFTASFEDAKIDEGKWAAQVVAQTNSKWSRTYPTADELKFDLQNLMYSQDVPIWSTSTYAQYRVMQLAKEIGVKVILDGQGGDELWAGYPHHQAIYLRELLAAGEWKAATSLLKTAGNFPSNAIWFGKQYYKHSGLSAFPSKLIPGLYKKYFNHLNYLNPDFYEQQKVRFEKQFDSAPKTVNELLHKETTSSLLKGYLKCEDRCSMWHSVESRTPFADDVNLVELAFRTPSSYKIRNNQSKYILRKAMEGMVPDAILNRQDKMGYSTPNNKWIAGIKDTVKDEFSANLGEILDIPKIQKEYAHMFGPEDGNDNGQSFKFISFALWHKIFKL